MYLQHRRVFLIHFEQNDRVHDFGIAIYIKYNAVKCVALIRNLISYIGRT